MRQPKEKSIGKKICRRKKDDNDFSRATTIHFQANLRIDIYAEIGSALHHAAAAETTHAVRIRSSYLLENCASGNNMQIPLFFPLIFLCTFVWITSICWFLATSIV